MNRLPRNHVLTDGELRKVRFNKFTKTLVDAGKSFYDLFKKLGENPPKSDLKTRIAKAKAKRERRNRFA